VGGPPPQSSPPLTDPAWLLATWFGAGLLPVAPGTWGSLAALPFGFVIAWLGGSFALVVAALVLFVIGCWAAERAQHLSGVADDGSIVIDEVVGQWLTLAAAPLTPAAYLTAFLLFRLFDIAKPWPARWIDHNFVGGVGVMTDDVIAALYGVLVLFLLRHLGGLFLGA
jgi:phosphatidylglycerophosphatase A